MRIYFPAILILLFASIYPQGNKTPYVIWFDKPAKDWNEALPVGNGRLGAMVFGSTSVERIQLNEESLWGGSKISNDNPQALKYLPEIREKILDGKIPEAYELSEKYIAGIPGKIRAYQVLADLYFQFDDTTGIVSNYRRELDLATGIDRISYKRDNNQIQYEVFASAPDNVIVIRMTSVKAGGLDMNVKMTRLKDVKIRAIENSIIMKGQVIDDDDPALGPGGADMKFFAKLVPLKFDGKISIKDDSLLVLKGGTEILFLFNAATDYRIDSLNFDRTIDTEKKCTDILTAASKKTYEELLSSHIKEHSSLFNR